MRLITFRGKSKKDRRWVYGSLVHGILGGKETPVEEVVYVGELVDGEFRGEEVYLGTVGQYTGLKDKKGQMIYEGDIFTRGGKFFYIVVFHKGGFKLKLLRGGFEDMLPLSRVAKYGEVIGNIHENPELLEGGEP